MTYYKRGSVWWIRFQRGHREIRMSLGTANKAEAKAIAEGMRIVRKCDNRAAALKILDVLFPPSSGDGITLVEAWKRYLDTERATGRANVSPRTLDTRRQVFTRFTTWAKVHSPSAVQVADVNGPVAAAFASHLVREGLAVKTRKNLIADLATIWGTLAKADGSVTANPWRGLSPRAERGEETRLAAFTREQEAAIMAAAKQVGKSWPLACLIARHTGLRYGDVARLTWADVDLDQRVINVTPHKTQRHGVTVCLPIAAPLYSALAEARPEGDPARQFILPGHALAVEAKSGTAYAALNFREVLTAAGIVGREFTFHSWRHTFRSRLAEAGVDIETAKRLCGHTNDEMSRHYDHASHLDEYRRAIDAAEK